MTKDRLLCFLLILCLVMMGIVGLPVAVQGASDQISLDVRQADLRDVLSALAVKTGTNIVLLEEPVKVTFSVEKVSPMKALELLLRSEGLSYIREGNLLIVGSAAKLQADEFKERALTRFDLTYLTIHQFVPLLEELDLPVKTITLESNPYAVWVEGSVDALVKVKELLAAVDLHENAAFGSGEYYSLVYEEFVSYNIEPGRLVELIQQAGYPIRRYVTLGHRLLVFDQEVLARWDEFYRLFLEMDKLDARQHNVFPFRLQHVVARDAADRLAAMGYPGVRVITSNFPQFSKYIFVVCPPELESQVYTSLTAIDVAPEKIKAIIMSAKGEYARRELQAKRKLLAELASIPSSSMYISDNISGNDDSPHYVLWAHETPDKIKLLQDIAATFN